MLYEVVYRWEDCRERHDEDQKLYRTEGGADEQKRIHNGLCPHYGNPMACAVVNKRPSLKLDEDNEVVPA